jgi:hypothetical protein
LNVRRAYVGDISAILAIKRDLRYAGDARGGFLLGSDEAGYRQRIQSGGAWVLTFNQQVAGFAITLSASAFAKTSVWELRHHVKWSRATHDVLNRGVAFFDQLAVKRGTSARAAALLAFTALWDVMAVDPYVVTTTVVSPIRNTAAVPLIESVGGSCVGELDEWYDDFGSLTSAVWLIDAEGAQRRVHSAVNTPRRDVLSNLARTAGRNGLVDFRFALT